ncbi:MAG TPA: glycosyltransferase family 87 protein [Edaphobacter sp.]|nr:glycosyltransferase family 87 protein [Edaphobacter sp.]
MGTAGKTTGSLSAAPALTGPRALWQLAVALFLGACALWHLHTMNRHMAPQKGDLVPVWIGAQVALDGGNPYSEETTRKIQTAYYGRPLTPQELRTVNKMGFAYPAHTLVLLSVLAPFSWMTVRAASFIVLPLLMAASVPLWLWTAGIRTDSWRMALLILLAVESWPSMWGIHQTQPTLLIAGLLAAGCLLLRTGNGVAAGVLLAMATIKPQLAGILIVWLLLWAAIRHLWSFLVSFAASLAILFAAATWLVPGWVQNWRGAMADYAAYRHLELGLMGIFGDWLGGALSAAIGVYSLFLLWRNRECTPESTTFGLMCAVALATTVCLSPTEPGMIYNGVLLLPAALIIGFARPLGHSAALARRIALMLLGWSFLAVAVSAACETIWHPSSAIDAIPFLNTLLPASITIALQLLATGPQKLSSETKTESHAALQYLETATSQFAVEALN